MDSHVPQTAEGELPVWLPRIVVVRGDSVATEALTTATARSIGRKARGLLAIPTPWTLPFVVVSSAMYSHWLDASESDRIKALEPWLDQITTSVTAVTGNIDASIIIRSSGCDEGLAQRGSYYSKIGRTNDLANLISAVFCQVSSDPNIGDKDLALIVQQYVEPNAKGHLSNERRCYEERRDWLGEIELQGSQRGHQFNVNLRRWRESEPAKFVQHENSALVCSERLRIPEVLRIPASSFYEKTSQRFHLEWIWSGKTIYVVQADEEDQSIGTDPHKSVVLAEKLPTIEELSVLLPLNEEQGKRYSKVRNVFIYQTLDLPTVPLFILEDATVIRDLSEGTMNPRLRSDIEILSRYPLIIRTDIAVSDPKEKQLLKRSDELRNSAEAIEWLIGAARELVQLGGPSTNRAFIFHNFVPATSSAFVFAAPNQRTVQVAGLWGLPEGLYYNSHDQFLIDTLRPNLQEALDLPPENYSVSKRCNYKPFFVCPDASGRWIRQIVAPPHDWRSSIWKENWLRKMAMDSRKIAENEGQPLSIMWFVGVNGSQRPDAIMPWFHEPFDISLLEQSSVSARKKNVWEKTHSISTRQDIDELTQIVGSSDGSNLKRIEVNPTEDALLRDKQALQQIGLLTKKIDATIVLAGAVLSHAYYQLVSTGAIVEVIHPFIGFEERQEFNKLVRDKIPAMIQGLGEEVTTARLDREGLLCALRSKLVEEAYEVADAQDFNELINELSDLKEVVNGILECIGKSSVDVEEVREEKLRRRGGFADGIVLLRTNKTVPSEASVPKDALFQDLIQEASGGVVRLNARQYAELYEKIEKWSDSRKSANWNETLVTIQVPCSTKNWNAQTKEISFDELDSTLIAEVVGERRKEKNHVELSLRIRRKQPELFPSMKTPNDQES